MALHARSRYPLLRWWPCLAQAVLLALLVLPVQAKEPRKAKAPRPPRVRKDAKHGWGGGSADAAGHGKPMQEQGQPKPLEELLEMPDWSTFYESYVRKNRPVVFRGSVVSQRAFGKWTDDYLTQHWGKRSVSVELNKTETRGGPQKEMAFGKFLTEMYMKEREGQLYAIVDFDKDKRAKADLDLPDPIRCKEVLPQSVTLWISSGGTTSVLHNDDAENVLMLLAGRKTVMLVHQDEAQRMYAPLAEHRGSSPVHQNAVDLTAFPAFANISWIHGEISAGDMLYIPHSYWHQVNSYDRNLGVNLWWQHAEDWRWWNPNNQREYDSMKFGSDGWMPFDELKARGPASLKCTALPSGKDLSKTRFMDESAFKRYAGKMRAKAKKKEEL